MVIFFFPSDYDEILFYTSYSHKKRKEKKKKRKKKYINIYIYREREREGEREREREVCLITTSIESFSIASIIG